MVDVKIHSGEFPSAAGVEDSYALSQLMVKWTRLAVDFPEDCSHLVEMIAETDRYRLWEKSIGGFTYPDRDTFLRQEVLLDFDLTARQAQEVFRAVQRGEHETVQAVFKAKADNPDALQAEIAKKVGISQPRVSQIISPGTNKRPKQRGDRIELSAGTDPAAAAERIRERLGDHFADSLKLALEHT